MKRALDEALERLAAEQPNLLGVVLSVTPDGVIAWAWSRSRQADAALGFAALHRAGVLCLDGLADDAPLQRLLLTSSTTWIASRPLRDPALRVGRAHLVLTTAFSGEDQAGRAVMHAARIRERVRSIVDAHAAPDCAAVRDALVDHLLQRSSSSRVCDLVARIQTLARELDVEPEQLARLDRLAPAERVRLTARLRGSR